MDRGERESNEEKKRKHSDNDDGREHSVKAKTSSSLEEKRDIIQEPLFDLNSSPPPEPPSEPVDPPPPPPSPVTQQPVDPPPPPPPAKSRRRRNPTQGPGEGKSEFIAPPFPWATDRRATIHSLNYLSNNDIHTIMGNVQCKRCDEKFTLEFNVNEKFYEVMGFIMEKKDEMHDRAPNVWMNPTLQNCNLCGQQNCVKPIIIPKNKKAINWLFLLLGQWIGLCSIDELKYFCKHNKNHRTGAKDRVLYSTYIALCKQLFPDAPFD
ncbi:hypothetical protein TanjilG_05105 [Lupinus angustifolius]|uniref:DUF7086 domain-containing protein n=1 Tax=Lupinus angustifolius TaxID=3871 RepID=A0A1J7GPP1_LUPAN|nr:PREDICTED: formin-like protein 20 [Lupinus angustifolius]OIV96265.1 hypothetical protein TanjilG_05105 [Lupinus angustifolius]